MLSCWPPVNILGALERQGKDMEPWGVRQSSSLRSSLAAAAAAAANTKAIYLCMREFPNSLFPSLLFLSVCVSFLSRPSLVCHQTHWFTHMFFDTTCVVSPSDFTAASVADNEKTSELLMQWSTPPMATARNDSNDLDYISSDGSADHVIFVIHASILLCSSCVSGNSTRIILYYRALANRPNSTACSSNTVSFQTIEIYC